MAWLWRCAPGTPYYETLLCVVWRRNYADWQMPSFHKRYVDNTLSMMPGLQEKAAFKPVAQRQYCTYQLSYRNVAQKHDAISHFLKFINGSEAWGNKTEKNYFLIPQPRFDFFCFTRKPRSHATPLIYRKLPINDTKSNYAYRHLTKIVYYSDLNE